jgi:hypothetical protein
MLVPVRKNIIFADETTISGGRFGHHRTRMRRPPPAKDGGRRGQGFSEFERAAVV